MKAPLEITMVNAFVAKNQGVLRVIKRYQEVQKVIIYIKFIKSIKNFKRFQKVSIAINSYQGVSRGLNSYQKVSSGVRSINIFRVSKVLGVSKTLKGSEY